MADTCLHENTRPVGDMPICDPESYEYLGRFNVIVCTDCDAVISREQIEEPPALTV